MRLVRRPLLNAMVGCGIVWVSCWATEPSYTGNTALILDSRTGDWVGSGLSWYYTAPSASFTAVQNSHNGVTISMTMGSECWTASFAAPDMAPLAVGTYGHVARYPFEGAPFRVPYDAGLDVYGGSDCSAGHGCSMLTGSFVVTELAWAENGDVASFQARFTQNCSGISPPLQGEVFFNSAQALPPPHHMTSPLLSYATEGQPFHYQITTSRPETTYSASGLPSGLTLNTTTGLISGIAEEHGAFNVMLTGSGHCARARALLSLWVDPPGRSTGPFTAMHVISTNGDPIGLGGEYSAADGDGTFVGGDQFYVDLVFSPWSAFENPPDSSSSLYIRLDGPTDVLVPGVYVDSNPDSGSPDLFAVVGNRSPFATTGSFTVNEIAGDPNGRMEHFRASFVQHANRFLLSPLRGWIWYQAENVITSLPYALGKEGRPFVYQIIANNQPSSYSCGALPGGLSLDQQSGRITGTPTASGSYNVTVNAIGPNAIASDVLSLNINSLRILANISTRAKVGLGDNSLIGGFIITGPESKRVIIRAIGPSLGAVGVPSALNDPILELHDGLGASIAVNDDWRAQQAEVEATGIPPSDDRESAIVATLAPGNYTAVITGKNGATGVGLVEVYDIGPAADSKLANISTRCYVDVDDNVLIGGFIVAGGNAELQSR